MTETTTETTTTEATNDAGAGREFNPEVSTQQTVEGMRTEAMQQQRTEEETGSLGGEAEATETTEASTEASTTDEGGTNAETEATTTNTETSYTFEGYAVEVKNDPAVEASFKEKGLDINAINAEIYSESGLTEASRAKLDEAFGASVVGMYLQGMKAQNEAMIAKQEVADEARDNIVQGMFKEVVGENSGKVFQWANDNLSRAEYNSYQEIINGNNQTAIRLAFTDLAGRSNMLKETPTTESVRSTALQGTSTGSGDDYAISAVDYHRAHVDGKYTGNEANWDARRQAGMKAGI